MTTSIEKMMSVLNIVGLYTSCKPHKKIDHFCELFLWCSIPCTQVELILSSFMIAHISVSAVTIGE